jgi:hypothetical protein
MLTLNGSQHAKGKQMHLCPLQFDICDRIIQRFTMPGETVYDPFGGLMTVPYRAIKAGRVGVGCELNAAYFLDGCMYCKAAVNDLAMPSLFDADTMDEEAAEPVVDTSEVTSPAESGEFPTDADCDKFLHDLGGAIKEVETIAEAAVKDETRDELFDKAAAIVRGKGEGSVAMVQRKLEIGYGRASRLIDQLVAAGVLGEFIGVGPRRAVVPFAVDLPRGTGKIGSTVDAGVACGRQMQSLRPEER